METMALAREANGYTFATTPSARSGQAVQAWTKSDLPPGQALRQPSPLFKKLDESVAEEEYVRLEA